MHPIVTIITPCYNGERFIERTIESVRAQTLKNWEYIIIDDGSSDKSVEIIERLAASEPRIRLIRQENSGKCAACNRGISEARGTYLGILDHDDLYHAGKLERQVQYLQAHPDAGMVYSRTVLISNSEDPPLDEEEEFYRNLNPVVCEQRLAVGPDGRRIHTGDDEVSLFPILIVTCCIATVSLLMRRDAALATGPFDSGCWPHDDWDFFLRFSRRYEIHKQAETLALYRWHHTNFSQNADAMASSWIAVCQKMGADPTLTQEERQHLRRALRANEYANAENCLIWAKSAWQEGAFQQMFRYYLRHLRIKTSLLYKYRDVQNPS